MMELQFAYLFCEAEVKRVRSKQAGECARNAYDVPVDLQDGVLADIQIGQDRRSGRHFSAVMS